jgi:hypothetical protein
MMYIMSFTDENIFQMNANINITFKIKKNSVIKKKEKNYARSKLKDYKIFIKRYKILYVRIHETYIYILY